MPWKDQPCHRSTLFILFILLHSSTQFLFNSTVPSVEIGPKNAFMFRGESLVMWCNVTDSESDVDLDELYFEVTNGPNSFRIPKENVTSFNGSVFTVLKITEEYLSYNTIHCMEQERMKDSTYVYVEESIENVTDVNAVYQYEGNFNVSWNFGKSYAETDNIQVNVCWNPYSPPVQSTSSCDVVTSDNNISLAITGPSIMFVSFTVYSKMRSKRPDLKFVLNPQPDSATSVVKFIVMNHLKPNAPSGFTVVNTNASSFDLTWEDPPYLRHSKRNSRYRVEVSVEHSKAFKRLVNGDVRPYSATRVPVKLQGLIPFTKYVVRLQVKTLDYGYWSDPVFTRNSTAEAQPISGPPVTNTSFYLENCRENSRKLIIYWKKIPERTLQGVLKGYTVKDFELQHSTPRVAQANFFESDITCSQSHHFGIFAENSVGSSQTPSIVFIPADEKLLQVSKKDLDFHIEESHNGYDKKNLMVKWNSSAFTDVNSWILTFYLCSESTPLTCFGDFAATRVNVTDNQLLLNDLPLDQTLMGYAVEADIGTKTGIQWTECIYQKKNLPPQSLELRVETGSTDKSVLISWNLPRCSRSTKVLITSMHLFLCLEEITPCALTKDSDIATCKYHEVLDTREMSYMWTGLKEDTIYHLYGRAESTGGLGLCVGPVVASVVGRSSSQKDSSYVIGVVLAVLTAVVIIAAAGVFIFRMYRKRQKHFHKLMMQDSDFIAQKPGEPKFKTQYSDESGVFSVTNSQEDCTSSQAVAQVMTDCSTNIIREITLSNNRLQQEVDPIQSSSAQITLAEVEPSGCENESKDATQSEVPPILTTYVGRQGENMNDYTKLEDNQLVEGDQENKGSSDVGLSSFSFSALVEELEGQGNGSQSESLPNHVTIGSQKNMGDYTKLENDQLVEGDQEKKGSSDVGLSSLTASLEELGNLENDCQSWSPTPTFTIGSQKNMDDYTKHENDQLVEASQEKKRDSDIGLSSLTASLEELEYQENDSQSWSPTPTFTIGSQKNMDDYTKLTNDQLAEGNQEEKGGCDARLSASGIQDDELEMLSNDSCNMPTPVSETASQWIADNINLIGNVGRLKHEPAVNDYSTMDEGTSAETSSPIDVNMGSTDVRECHNTPTLQGIDKRHEGFLLSTDC